MRRVVPADRPGLAAFDRGDAVDYRHWPAHRACPPVQGDALQLAIETFDGVLVGSVCTTPTSPRTGRFGYGIGIGPAHQRRGYADDAIGVLLDFMFARRRYRKCEVGIFRCNHASLCLHRKLGFREEARLRDPESGLRPLVLMGLTAEEFAARPALSRR
ncbi:GNAT family N-acetyltransferase [Saccharopolyspora taberi]|uniref:GNAT family N-acetyltransferase n=1 Tax=Saccharopolyspora taberi TaxID=60895 RepID=A0ABN3VHU5_9PSEU